MFVSYDDDDPPPRRHPWQNVEGRPAKYWDFRAHPELIESVLEDFVPWAKYAATQRFYELLAWLNGTSSCFESNDCGLLPPRLDSATPDLVRPAFESDPLVVHGRLVFFFRELAWNTWRPTIDGLKRGIHDGLRDHVNNFPAVVKIGEWAHLFASIDTAGHAVCLRFWAWGVDEDMAMANLHATFVAIDGCLRWISDGIKGGAAERRIEKGR